MKPYTSDDVEKNPIAFSFRQSEGYKYEGALPMPSLPLKVPSDCEPSTPAEKGSWHLLKMPVPNEGTTLKAMWDPDTKYWTPPLQSHGRRVAFTSAYLAAHGWSYGEPVL